MDRTDERRHQDRIVVPRELERSHGRLRADRSADTSALALLGQLADILGVEDLGTQSLLDVGCGVKFTRALLNHGLPVGRYVGIDVHEPVIAFLRGAVVDERFAFAHFDVRNERYNPGGRPMGRDLDLPVGDERFDVALGYSLVTHLDPGDVAVLAALLRRVVRPGGRWVFTAFLDEHSDGGQGMVDRYSQKMGASIAGASKGSFVDYHRDDPLRVALYDRHHLRSLLEGEGWAVSAVHAPTPHAQHTVVAVTA